MMRPLQAMKRGVVPPLCWTVLCVAALRGAPSRAAAIHPTSFETHVHGHSTLGAGWERHEDRDNPAGVFSSSDFVDTYLTDGQSSARGFASNTSFATDTCIAAFGVVTGSRQGAPPWTYAAKTYTDIRFQVFRATRVTGTMQLAKDPQLQCHANGQVVQWFRESPTELRGHEVFGGDAETVPALTINKRVPPGSYTFFFDAEIHPMPQPFYPGSSALTSFQVQLCFEPATDTVLVSQPTPTTVRRGETIALSVTPTPESPAPTGTVTTTYQWQREGVDLVDGGRVFGAQSPNLVIAYAAIADSGWYRVIATRDTVVEPSVFARVDVLDLDAADDALGPAPATLALAAPVPNPVRSGARFHFALPRDARVTLELLDVSGRRVRELLRGPLAAGAHDAAWDGRDDDGSRVPAGVYFVRVSTDDAQQTRRVVYMPLAR